MYENLIITELQPLPSCQGTVTVTGRGSRKKVKIRRAARQKAIRDDGAAANKAVQDTSAQSKLKQNTRASSSSPLLDLLIRQCIVCLAFVAVLTVVNIFGFTNIVQGVVKIMDSHSVTDLLYGTMYV